MYRLYTHINKTRVESYSLQLRKNMLNYGVYVYRERLGTFSNLFSCKKYTSYMIIPFYYNMSCCVFSTEEGFDF